MGAGVERLCESCGGPYETKRSTARFCSARCGKRGQRGHLVEATVPPVQPAPDPPALGLFAAVGRELTVAARLDSAAGQAALTLARRVEAGQDTGAGLASLMRQMHASLELAVAGAAVAADPVDELRARRDRKHAG